VWGAVAAVVVLAIVLAVALGGGDDSVELTSFVGKTVGQATAAANHQGVVLQVLKRQADAPQNTVVSQVPKAGTEVPRGATVILLVSTGPSGDSSGIEPSPPPASPAGGEGPDHGKHNGKGPKEKHEHGD
jgi:beta-lactam-binding protein with PASTA domain